MGRTSTKAREKIKMVWKRCVKVKSYDRRRRIQMDQPNKREKEGL